MQIVNKQTNKKIHNKINLEFNSYIDKVLAFCLSSSSSSHRAFQCEIGKSQGYTTSDRSTDFPCAYSAMRIRVRKARRLNDSARPAYISATSIYASIVSNPESLSIVNSTAGLENDIDFIRIT